MWRRASCEQQLDTSQSILSTRGNPMPMREIALLNEKYFSPRAKGNPVHIPEPGTGTVPICGRIPIPLGREILYEFSSESGTEFVGVTQQNPETPSGDPERVFFSL